MVTAGALVLRMGQSNGGWLDLSCSQVASDLVAATAALAGAHHVAHCATSLHRAWAVHSVGLHLDRTKHCVVACAVHLARWVNLVTS